MRAGIQEGFDTIERQRTEIEAAVSALSDAQREWRTAEGEWSARDVLEHLVLSDEAVGRVRALEAMEIVPPPVRLLPPAVRRRMILGALRRNVRLPLPSPGIAPGSGESLAVLLERWATVRDAMREELARSRKGDAPYSHPILGALTAEGMLELDEAHLGYHARQIATIRRSPGFPA